MLSPKQDLDNNGTRVPIGNIVYLGMLSPKQDLGGDKPRPIRRESSPFPATYKSFIILEATITDR
jgi:hypothetical protein